ncbi:MAG: glycosyltransferase [Bacteroidetes bacterium]|nr:glycosyltransferase [Bacteroidota bacterium]
MRVLITIGLIELLIFSIWFFDPSHIGYLPLYILLSISIGFRFLKTLHEWYHYGGISVPPPKEITREWSVDMLTTACPGEPIDMIRKTLEAMVKVEYPHTNYLCDEGNDPVLKKICEDLGVIHVYRGTNKTNAKAGNINYALDNIATGEISVILDPDHIPHPLFLHEVLPYFDEEKVGFVQCIQAYHNRRESMVSRGASEQTYHFYGPMMMSMNSYGTVQAIGANCAFRRAALDSIGGHAPGLSEDMHTSMLLHSKGWESVYVPVALTRGEVPGTMASYYKQQLKWSRGSLELLFFVIPRIFKSLTWRQRIHYLSIPLHFMFGLVVLMDLLIPIFALFLAESPIIVNLFDLLLYATPLIITTLLIRQYAQNWVLEQQERGFHMIGGILLTGTWWVHVVGFVCTLLRINIPYIPTPKQDKAQNAWSLSIPNILAVVISLAAILYGLSYDWSPYSVMMAGFAMTNMMILGFTVMMGQQKLLHRISRFIRARGKFMHWLRDGFYNFKHRGIFSPLRNVAVIGITLFIIIAGSYAWKNRYRGLKLAELKPQIEKPSEGFYLGVPLSEKRKSQPYKANRADLLMSTVKWQDTLALNQTIDLMQRLAIADSRSQVLINWLPDTNRVEKNPFEAIASGEYDKYLNEVARSFQHFDQTVFVNFAPEVGNPEKPYALPSGEYTFAYQNAWKHVFHTFADLGVANVVWVWTPYSIESTNFFYPGSEYVDWVGIPYRGEFHKDEFARAYGAFSDIFSPFPTLVFDQSEGKCQDLHACSRELGVLMRDSFPEIQGWVLDNELENGDFAAQWQALTREMNKFRAFAPPPFIPEKKKNPSLLANGATIDPSLISPVHQKMPKPGQVILEKEGNEYYLQVDGKPFYIKGITYNPGHDWRDAYSPLVRKQLETDFKRMADMGANVVRRYKPTFYDYNILNVARENDLKVLYGFYFDPEIDYYADTARVNDTKKRVLHRIESMRGETTILAWGLGNETWGLLKHHFRPSYLPRVRKAYLNMLEDLAKDIKKIDPDHLIFSALEHSEDLQVGLTSFHSKVPGLDFISINSYYTPRISTLDSIASRYYPNQPYLVSEFGPAGYWAPEYTVTDGREQLVESSSYQKAREYIDNWQNYISPYEGKNLGGVAFCWRDRFEGTATWFGITDINNRIKPGYYALKEAWTGEKVPFPIADAYIIPPWEVSNYRLSKVVTKDYKRRDLHYEWYICRETMLERVGSVNLQDRGRAALIELPGEDSDYRIYVHISDEEGNVVTASTPIVPRKNN